MIGALSSWSYPLRGILCLSRTPQLRQLVQRFLLSVTATSAATSCVWLYLFYNRHVQLIANVFGGAKTSSPGLFTKATAALVVLAESTLPVYLLFGRRFEQLQQQLFDATVQLQAVHFSQLLPTEQEALAAAVAARQQQRAQAAAAAAAAWRGMGMTGKAARLLLGGVTNVKGFITQLVLKPEPHEGLLIRQVRGVVTGVVGGLLPPLLPVLALRDSGVAAARLLGRYWDKKGVPHSAGEQQKCCRVGGAASGATIVTTAAELLDW